MHSNPLACFYKFSCVDYPNDSWNTVVFAFIDIISQTKLRTYKGHDQFGEIQYHSSWLEMSTEK